jgi:hypothetical protein
MKEQTWLVLRQHGMVIEEAIHDEYEAFEEHALAEKFALQFGVGDLASNILSNTKESKER